MDETGFADLPGRGLLEATGPRRQAFLQGMLSNDVVGLVPGQGCRAAFLTERGHIRALLRVLVRKDSVELELPAGRLDEVERLLNYYKVAAPVRFRPRPTAVMALVGGQAHDLLGRTGVELPSLSAEGYVQTEINGQTVTLVAAGDMPAAGLVLHMSPEGRDAVADALANAGARAIDATTLDALRVEDGRAWFGPDVTEENLLHETGLVSEYASFTKGCYVGQEVVARLDARGGNVSRRLRGLRLAAPTRAGSLLYADGKEVGRVTTAAASRHLGPIAMGYVHRGHSEPGTVVDVDGTPATVAALPLRVARPPS